MTMVPINVSAIDPYLEAMWGLGGTGARLRLVRRTTDGEHDHCGQDAEDHDDDEELDERETLLGQVLVVPLFGLADVLQHWILSQSRPKGSRGA